MTESSVGEMMTCLREEKNAFLFMTLTVYTLFFVGLLIVALLVKNYVFQFHYGSIFKILLVIYLITVSYKLYEHKFGVKNHIPYYGATPSCGLMYVAYYECTKCESLYGGFLGKGPIKQSIIDEECIHSWDALRKEKFNEKYGK